MDAHVCGQPFRLILSGFPIPRGTTLLERSEEILKNMDHLRTALVSEPRGHEEMQCALLCPPQRRGSQLGILFFNKSGFQPMSGHGLVAAATICLEAQRLEMKAPETLLRFDTVAGMVRVFAAADGERVKSVFYENVPSFALDASFAVAVPKLGRIAFVAAYGGEYHAYIDSQGLNLSLAPQNIAQIRSLGTAISQSITEQFEFTHPTDSHLGKLGGIVFHGPAVRRRAEQPQVRLVCVRPDGMVDRSPSGTALSGWMALLENRGKVQLQEAYLAEGILGGTMSAKVAREGVQQGEYRCVLIEIEGKAHITGRHSFFLAEDDPFRSGFSI